MSTPGAEFLQEVSSAFEAFAGLAPFFSQKYRALEGSTLYRAAPDLRLSGAQGGSGKPKSGFAHMSFTALVRPGHRVSWNLRFGHVQGQWLLDAWAEHGEHLLEDNEPLLSEDLVRLPRKALSSDNDLFAELRRATAELVCHAKELDLRRFAACSG